MRILLRNRDTGLYYATRDQWTPSIDEAHAFASSYDAIVEATRMRANLATELVYSFPNPKDDFSMPMRYTA